MWDSWVGFPGIPVPLVPPLLFPPDDELFPELFPPNGVLFPSCFHQTACSDCWRSASQSSDPHRLILHGVVVEFPLVVALLQLVSIRDGLSTGSVKPTMGPPPPNVVAEVPVRLIRRAKPSWILAWWSAWSGKHRRPTGWRPTKARGRRAGRVRKTAVSAVRTDPGWRPARHSRRLLWSLRDCIHRSSPTKAGPSAAARRIPAAARAPVRRTRLPVIFAGQRIFVLPAQKAHLVRLDELVDGCGVGTNF